MRTRDPLAAELTRKRWNAETARKVLAAWRRSGMSGSAFAEVNGLNSQRLFWWRKQLAPEATTEEAPLRFLPATTLVAMPARVSVRLPGGVEIDAGTAAALPPMWLGLLARELSRQP
jgi:hypothetical protein